MIYIADHDIPDPPLDPCLEPGCRRKVYGRAWCAVHKPKIKKLPGMRRAPRTWIGVALMAALMIALAIAGAELGALIEARHNAGCVCPPAEARP